MGKEDGRGFGVKPALEFFRRKLGKANPVSASIEGPILSDDEIKTIHLEGIDGTFKAFSQEPERKFGFHEIAEHRKWRMRREERRRK